MNQLLGSLSYEQGSLSLQNARYLLVRPTLIIELQKAVEGYLPQDVGAIFQQTAASDGAGLAGRFRDVFGYPEEQVLSAVAFMLSESGWGDVAVEMVNLDGRELVFKVLESPFAEVYGPSTQPVCHTLLGTFQGVAMTLFESEARGMEVQCQAKGDSCCRFVVSGAAAG